MKQEDIEKLFPLSVTIDEGIDFNINIGMQLLCRNLPKELHDDIFWGLSIGSVKGVLIKTEEIIKWEGKMIITPFYLQNDRVNNGIEIIFKQRKLKQ
jgi:hypothetical protein